MSLLDAAREVREAAYAPYSNFKVGAAVRGKSGAIYRGCNVENVAYPEGTCAEAGAIAAMVAANTRPADVTTPPVPAIDRMMPVLRPAWISSLNRDTSSRL